ncbi:MAG: hypothetical protein GY759_24705 [Chloroflexi bacterium]|nr:hypothetical protein [Chloroflexota bacterium]
MTHIQVYIAHRCPMCIHSRRLVAEISDRCPRLDIELINVASLPEEEVPKEVFATPTWLWDGQVYSLGNPDPAQLWQQLAALSLPPTETPFEDKRHGRKDATSFDDGAISGSIREGT